MLFNNGLESCSGLTWLTLYWGAADQIGAQVSSVFMQVSLIRTALWKLGAWRLNYAGPGPGSAIKPEKVSSRSTPTRARRRKTCCLSHLFASSQLAIESFHKCQSKCMLCSGLPCQDDLSHLQGMQTRAPVRTCPRMPFVGCMPTLTAACWAIYAGIQAKVMTKLLRRQSRSSKPQHRRWEVCTSKQHMRCCGQRSA